LLNVRRSELRAYLRRKKQNWREDLTNRDPKRLRARIRRKLLPLLEKQFRPRIVEHLATLADLAREDEAALQGQAELRVCAVAQKTEGSLAIPAKDIARPKSASRNGPEEGEEQDKIAIDSAGVRKRMVRHIVAQMKPRQGQLGANHVDAVLELARRGKNGSSLSLPGGVEVRRVRETLVFRATENAKQGTTDHAASQYEYNIDLARGSQETRVPELGCVLRLRVIDWPSERGETNREMVLDRDRLRSPLVLRNWRPGDRMRPCGHRNAHKLKRLLNEKRIGRWDRDAWPVLTSGGDLVWARGFPVAADFAANERTRAGIVIAEEPF
jgi:tRNA(Ile)-lysidine synthase